MRTKKEQEVKSETPRLSVVPLATDDAFVEWLIEEGAAQIAREDEEVERMRRGELPPNPR